MQGDDSGMQRGSLHWPVAPSTSFEFYNSVAGSEVAKAGTLTIRLSKRPVAVVTALATCSSSERITFFVLF